MRLGDVVNPEAAQWGKPLSGVRILALEHPGLPVKFAEVAEGPELRVPWLGEHADTVLKAELGARARRAGVGSGPTA